MAEKRHSPEYIAYLASPEWASKRAAVLRRAGGKCECCGHPKPLQVHHRHYRNLWDEPLEDLRALCIDCHGLEDLSRADNDRLDREASRRSVEAANPRCPHCQDGIGKSTAIDGVPRGLTPMFRCRLCQRTWWRDERHDIIWDGQKEIRIERGDGR